MSKGGGGSSNTTTVQKADPWGGAQPALTTALGMYETQKDTPYQAYQGQRIADLAPEQRMGLNMTTNRALNGSPVMNAAQQNLQGTLSGQYMNPNSNPWLQQNVQTAMDQAQGNIDSRFNRPGAFGSSAHEGVTARELGKISAGMYGQNYDQERTRQMQANMFAPQAAASDYADAQAMVGVGDAYRGLEQDQLNQAYTDWYDKTNYQKDMADWYGQRVGAIAGMGGQTTSKGPNPYQSNPLGNMLGGAGLAYGIGSAAGGAAAGGLGALAGPWGLAGGALLGGLL